MSQTLGIELVSLPAAECAPEWLESCDPICAYSSDRLEDIEPMFSRSNAREAALKSGGAQGDLGTPEVVLQGSSQLSILGLLGEVRLQWRSPGAVVMQGGLTTSSSKSCSSTDCCGDLGASLGISLGPSAGPASAEVAESFLKASSGLLCKVTNLENTCLISSVLSTQFTKWAASEVASTPLVGCAACSPPRLPARGFCFLELALVDVLRSPVEGTQQQPLPVFDRPVAGKLRCNRSECNKLHSARHRK
mmetsp:Transcript_10847/g.22127  ORF Transcript_10847/g.22127 Transcript_10847/m.22127 type:complete len:249 (+) Transcript_10847:370-1116(+)